jgi:hypothetical protein
MPITSLSESVAPANNVRRPEVMPMQSWGEWQREVVRLLREELAEALHQVSLNDVDWCAWQQYFRAGHSPQAAIDRAFERAL